jgi:hypothetical protein
MALAVAVLGPLRERILPFNMQILPAKPLLALAGLTVKTLPTGHRAQEGILAFLLFRDKVNLRRAAAGDPAVATAGAAALAALRITEQAAAPTAGMAGMAAVAAANPAPVAA